MLTQLDFKTMYLSVSSGVCHRSQVLASTLHLLQGAGLPTRLDAAGLFITHLSMHVTMCPSVVFRSLSSFPEGSWDDVRVRYTYYKEQGYLRDLTLQDYVKWEEWWYKYQDWLNAERYYDRSER